MNDMTTLQVPKPPDQSDYEISSLKDGNWAPPVSRNADEGIHINTMQLEHKNFSLHIEDVTVGGNLCTAIIGPNGSGKTRLLESLMGLTAASTQMSLLGQPQTVAACPSHIRRQIGVQMLDEGYPERLRVSDLLKTHRLLFGKSDARIAETLQMDTIAHKRMKDLSCGERQRFKLFTAWAHQPKVIFMDEPFTGLDPHFCNILKDLIASRDAQTILMTCHSAEGIEVADDVVWMKNGRVMKQDSPLRLMLDLLGSYRVTFECHDEATLTRIAEILKASGPLKYLSTPQPELLVAYGASHLARTAKDIFASENVDSHASARVTLTDFIEFCARGGRYV